MQTLRNLEQDKTMLQDRYLQPTNATIMIVDDELINLNMVQAYLEDLGYSRFILVEKSTEAMKALEDTAPDLLILDLMMPEVSGFDILSKVRTHEKLKHLPVIILTASTDTESKLRSLDMGANDFLIKPVDSSELCLRVRNTIAAKAYQDQLAYYDTLTGLPNRHMFLDCFDWALKKAQRFCENLALLNIGVDNFDMINATFRASLGDEVLSQLARRIESLIRNYDVLGQSIEIEDAVINLFRLESSSFSVLLERIHCAEDAAMVADRIVKAIREPLQIDNEDYYVTASIGIAYYPAESGDCFSLLQLASGAKDYVRKKGGDSFQFSSSTINAIYSKRLSLETKLRKSLDRGELDLQYQPKVDVATGVIKGVETLLRWNNSEIGLVSPNDFIQLAEETGLIIPIGEWILNKAFIQLAEWHKTKKTPIGMSINLSAKQFNNREFFAIVKRIVEHSSVEPRFLTFEITESLMLDDIENTNSIMKRFRDMGLTLSIDDFGKGFSSLSYLSELPVDELKIDKSFIDNLPDKSKSCNIVSSIISLAHILGLQAVAEGVETEAQLDYLKKENCHQYQGYLFSQPLSNTELFKFLRPRE